MSEKLVSNRPRGGRRKVNYQGIREHPQNQAAQRSMPPPSPPAYRVACERARLTGWPQRPEVSLYTGNSSPVTRKMVLAHAGDCTQTSRERSPLDHKGSLVWLNWAQTIQVYPASNPTGTYGRSSCTRYHPVAGTTRPQRDGGSVVR